MFICVTNGSERNSENYDLLIDLLKNEKVTINNYYISKNGYVDNFIEAKNKKDLQKNYTKNINQIVSNNKNTNFSEITKTNEIIHYVGIGKHMEFEI